MEIKNKKAASVPVSIILSLMASISIIITAFISTYYYSWYSNTLYNSEITNNISMVADTAAPRIAGPLSLEDRESVEEIIADIITINQNIDDAIVIRKEDEEVFYDSDGSRIGKKESQELKMTGLIYVETPIILEAGFGFGLTVSKEEIGSLYLGVKEEHYLINERLRSVVNFALNISHNVAIHIESGNYIRARDIMGNMVENRDNILFAELLNFNGEILFYSEKNLSEEEAREVEGTVVEGEIAGKALGVSVTKPLLIQNAVGKNNEKMLDIAVLVSKNKEKLGVIRIGYSLEDFLRRQSKSRVRLIGVAALLAVIGIAVALILAFRFSGPIRRLATVARQIGEGNLDQTVKIKSGGKEIRELGESFNQMIAGLKERDLVKDTFSRYVTKQVADELLQNPERIALGGKRQEVTVLFSDIRGFTTFSESHPPEEVVAHLNEYLSAMVDVIFKYEGTLDKYIGDAVMAVFGSPIKHEDDPLRAAKTALEMQDRLNDLNKKWQDEDKPPLKIGIGINTGEVIAGNIGDIRRMEYTVIGDNVNLASRIEGLTKSYNCPIIISESTYAEIKDRVEARKLEAAMVKGKIHSVEIYELIGLK